jgi:hypothetical protein
VGAFPHPFFTLASKPLPLAGRKPIGFSIKYPGGLERMPSYTPMTTTDLLHLFTCLPVYLSTYPNHPTTLCLPSHHPTPFSIDGVHNFTNNKSHEFQHIPSRLHKFSHHLTFYLNLSISPFIQQPQTINKKLCAFAPPAPAQWGSRPCVKNIPNLQISEIRATRYLGVLQVFVVNVFSNHLTPITYNIYLTQLLSTLAPLASPAPELQGSR